MDMKERMLLIEKFNDFLREYSKSYSPDVINVIKRYFWEKSRLFDNT